MSSDDDFQIYEEQVVIITPNFDFNNFNQVTQVPTQRLLVYKLSLHLFINFFHNLSLFQQLKHIRAAIIAAPEGPERDELVILQSNIEELLALTRDNNQDVDNQQPSTSSKNIDDEYARFQAELATVADADGERKVDDGRVREGGGGTDWGHLEGTKCRVPHAHLWGGTAYHNAIVCSVIGPEDEDGDVDDYDDVKVISDKIS